MINCAEIEEMTLDTCECGWKSKSQNPSASSRAAVNHMRKCPLRGDKAAETRNLPKRGISDTDMGSAGEVSMEPPQKVPRLFTVSRCNGETCEVQENTRVNGPVTGGALL